MTWGRKLAREIYSHVIKFETISRIDRMETLYLGLRPAVENLPSSVECLIIEPGKVRRQRPISSEAL